MLMDIANKQLQSIVFDRVYTLLSTEREYELDLFADAAEQVVGAAVYLRIISHGEF